MTITEFLTARYDEDEAAAQAVIDSTEWGWASVDFNSSDAEEHGSRWSPARVLADIAAKRAIVELHAPIEDRNWVSGASHGYLWCSSCGSLDDSPEPYPCRTTRALLQPLADHSDFDPAWRV